MPSPTEEIQAAIQRVRELDRGATKAWQSCTWDPMERPHVHGELPADRHCKKETDIPQTVGDAAFMEAARLGWSRFAEALEDARVTLQTMTETSGDRGFYRGAALACLERVASLLRGGKE